MTTLHSHATSLTHPATQPGSSWLSRLGRISQLRINILSGVFTNGINVLVMAVSYPLYLHYLGYEKVGLWLLLTSVQSFAQLGLLGIGPAVTKLVAEEMGRGNKARAQSYISQSTCILFITGLIALLALCLWRKPIIGAMGLGQADSISALNLLPWVGLLTAFGFLNQATTASLAGVGRMDLANCDATIGKVIALGLEAILLMKKAGLLTLLLGDFAGCAVIQITGSIQLRRLAGLALFKSLDWNRERFFKLLHFGGNMFIASLAVLLVSPLNKWALSRYAGVALIPVYDIAFNGSMQLRGLLEVGLRALMPAVSHQLAGQTAEGFANVQRLYKRTTLGLLLILPPGYLLSVLLAKPLLSLWLGSRFVPAIVPVFNLMFASAVVSLVAVPAFFTLMACGHVRACMVSHLLAAGVNILIIAGAVWLHGSLSVYTAAFSVLMTMVISSGYLLLRIRTVFAARSDRFIPSPDLPPHSLN